MILSEFVNFRVNLRVKFRQSVNFCYEFDKAIQITEYGLPKFAQSANFLNGKKCEIARI